MQIRNFEGKDKLRSFLPVFRNDPDFPEIVRRIGIVRDADKCAQSAFDSVLSSLRQAGLPQPAQLGARSGDRPDVSVFVMPDNKLPGTLETLLQDTFKCTPIDRYIDKYFTRVQRLPGIELHPYKARVHAWLATRPEPHVSVGYAAKKGYWDMGHQALKGIREFLLALRDGAGEP